MNLRITNQYIKERERREFTSAAYQDYVRIVLTRFGLEIVLLT